MSQRIFKKLQTPEGLGRGQTATVKFPIGSKFHDCSIVTNMDLADMTEIRLIANNKTIHRYSATERDAINQFFGLPAFGSEKILYIPFDRKALKSRNMEEVTGINTGVETDKGDTIRALYLEVDIRDTDYSLGTTAPTMEVFSTTSAATEDGTGTVMHVTKHNRSAAGAGELEVSDLPFNAPTAAALNACFLFPSENDISRIVVERGLYKVWERKKALNERMAKIGERVPQSGMHAIDFTENGYGANALDLRGYQDFRYRLDVTGASQITFISEYLGILGD